MTHIIVKRPPHCDSFALGNYGSQTVLRSPELHLISKEISIRVPLNLFPHPVVGLYQGWAEQVPRCILKMRLDVLVYVTRKRVLAVDGQCMQVSFLLFWEAPYFDSGKIIGTAVAVSSPVHYLKLLFCQEGHPPGQAAEDILLLKCIS